MISSAQGQLRLESGVWNRRQSLLLQHDEDIAVWMPATIVDIMLGFKTEHGGSLKILASE